MNEQRRHEPGEENNDQKRFVDKVTDEKIHRHLHDINDTISEDDIRNIVTDISSPASVNDEDATTANRDEGNAEGDNQNDQLPTSWNVID